jgi:hypothetical protein
MMTTKIITSYGTTADDKIMQCQLLGLTLDCGAEHCFDF